MITKISFDNGGPRVFSILIPSINVKLTTKNGLLWIKRYVHISGEHEILEKTYKALKTEVCSFFSVVWINNNCLEVILKNTNWYFNISYENILSPEEASLAYEEAKKQLYQILNH